MTDDQGIGHATYRGTCRECEREIALSRHFQDNRNDPTIWVRCSECGTITTCHHPRARG